MSGVEYDDPYDAIEADWESKLEGLPVIDHIPKRLREVSDPLTEKGHYVRSGMTYRLVMAEGKTMTEDLVNTLKVQVEAMENLGGSTSLVLRGRAGRFLDHRPPSALDRGHLTDDQLADAAAQLKEEYIMLWGAASMTKPFIPVISGPAFGPGLSLCIHAVRSVATTRAVLAIDEPSRGLAPGGGTTHVLWKLGPLGTFLALTGYKLDGSDSVHANLARYLMDWQNSTALEARLNDLHGASFQVDNALGENCYDQDELPDFSLGKYMEEINDVFSETSLSGVLQKLKKSDTFFAERCLTRIYSQSPLAVGVTFQLLQDPNSFSLIKALNRDFTVALRMARTPACATGLSETEWESIATGDNVQSIVNDPLGESSLFDESSIVNDMELRKNMFRLPSKSLYIYSEEQIKEMEANE